MLKKCKYYLNVFTTNNKLAVTFGQSIDITLQKSTWSICSVCTCISIYMDQRKGIFFNYSKSLIFPCNVHVGFID